MTVGDPIEYVLTLPTGREPVRVRLHCVGTVLRMEERQAMRENERAFHVAATLDRYEFVRDGR
jgi:hypothetical protein